MTKQTPLHDEHVAAGATLVDFAGWHMPLRYTSDLAEHRAVRESAGLFDLSHMAEFAVTGPDAARFLDYALVSDLSAVAPGRAKYTMICNADGAVLDDLVVYRFADDDFMVVANAANTDVVELSLRSAADGFDVTITDNTEATALIAVQGPVAVDILGPLVADDIVGMKYYSALRTTVDGVESVVARTGYTGEDGFELFVSAADAPALWRRLREAGGDRLTLAGLAARDSLRLEAGMPLYGNELNSHTTPYAARLGRVVALKKAAPDGTPLPFVGRAALTARAHSEPSRLLVGLRGIGRRAARAGYEVLIGTTPERSSVIGHVTSGMPSPTLGYPIAMAYVSPEFAGEGTRVGVDIRGTAEAFEVVPLPFYRRQQKG